MIKKRKKERKRTYYLEDFAISADHRVKIKESEKRDKYLDFARELRKLWNMKVKVIPNDIGALGMINKDSERRREELDIEGRKMTIKTSPGDLRRGYSHSDSREIPITNAGIHNDVFYKLWNKLIIVSYMRANNRYNNAMLSH